MSSGYLATCSACGVTIDLYSEDYEFDEKSCTWSHVYGGCPTPRPKYVSDYVRQCFCCGASINLKDLAFVTEKHIDGVFCSKECIKKHTTSCTYNVEEPDIVY